MNFKTRPQDCKLVGACECPTTRKARTCHFCDYYYSWTLFDRYGYCQGLPEPVLVPWCKDVCCLFSKNRIFRKNHRKGGRLNAQKFT